MTALKEVILVGGLLLSIEIGSWIRLKYGIPKWLKPIEGKGNALFNKYVLGQGPP